MIIQYNMIIQTAITHKIPAKITQKLHKSKYCIYLMHPFNPKPDQ